MGSMAGPVLTGRTQEPHTENRSRRREREHSLLSAGGRCQGTGAFWGTGGSQRGRLEWYGNLQHDSNEQLHPFFYLSTIIVCFTRSIHWGYRRSRHRRCLLDSSSMRGALLLVSASSQAPVHTHRYGRRWYVIHDGTLICRPTHIPPAFRLKYTQELVRTPFAPPKALPAMEADRAGLDRNSSACIIASSYTPYLVTDPATACFRRLSTLQYGENRKLGVRTYRPAERAWTGVGSRFTRRAAELGCPAATSGESDGRRGRVPCFISSHFFTVLSNFLSDPRLSRRTSLALGQSIKLGPY
ncbi:hypothetical protein OH76DRAFT_626271 [Lentinus brumalis]|uniref:Uncharacterized protein n=1 Tax=Lentinus brumalis TaxID=2498619 RepID=A0A371D873_9APHY|nr:hypothetical protein OH76DRAFT_626271 [Polyporus brumalis]